MTLNSPRTSLADQTLRSRSEAILSYLDGNAAFYIDHRTIWLKSEHPTLLSPDGLLTQIATLRKDTDRFVASMAQRLTTFPLYGTSDEIEDILISSALLPDFPDVALSSLALPSSTGYLWLEDEIRVSFTDSEDQHLHEGEEADQHTHLAWETACCAIHWEYDPEDQILYLYVYAFAEDFRESERRPPTLIPITMTQWRMGDSWAVRAYVDIFIPIWNLPLRYGIDTDEGISTAEQDMGLWARKILAIFFLFLEEPLTLQTTERISRAERRRRSKEEEAPEIQIIQLRQAKRDSTGQLEVSSSQRAYNVRWTVDPHWRNQYYASTDTHKPKYIHAYVKGPEGKPLKSKPVKIFEVSR